MRNSLRGFMTNTPTESIENPSETGFLMFTSNWTGGSTSAAYNARGGGEQVAPGATSAIVNDPAGVVDPRTGATRKVRRTDVSWQDYFPGDTADPVRCRSQCIVATPWKDPGGSVRPFDNGDTWWHGGAFYYPSDFPTSFPSQYPSSWINQAHHSTNSGAQAGNVWLRSGDSWGKTPASSMWFGGSQGSPGSVRITQHGQWIEYVMKVTLSQTGTGAQKVWVNTGPDGTNGWSLICDQTGLSNRDLTGNQPDGQALWGPVCYFPQVLINPNTVTDPDWMDRTIIQYAADVRVATSFSMARPLSYASSSALPAGES
jgi:hypothetical protein